MVDPAAWKTSDDERVVVNGGQAGAEEALCGEEDAARAETGQASLEITAEELDAVCLSREATGKVREEVSGWEITAEELDTIRPGLKFTTEELDAVLVSKSSSPIEPGKIRLKQERFKEKVFRQIPTNLWQMAVAGLIGAILAWVVDECFGQSFNTYRTFSEVVLEMALWGCIISGIIGFSFGTVGSLLNRQYGLALKKGFRWMLGAAIGGFVGSGGGQMLYSLLLGGISRPFFRQILARTLGWTLLGAGMGMANGWMAGDKKRVVNGLIGGLAGGAAGGLVFDLICIPLPYGNGSVARLIGFMALGGGIGALIGLVEHLRREVWFAAISGPMQGKEFILFGAQTVFGSSSKADIVLYGDPSVPPYAFRVEVVSDRDYRGTDLTGQGMVKHNNLPVQQFMLRNGDLIGIGNHLLQFRVKVG